MMRVTTALRWACLGYQDLACRASMPQAAQAPARAAQPADTLLRWGKLAASYVMRVTTALRLVYPALARRASIPQAAQSPARVARRANTRQIPVSRAASYVMRVTTVLRLAYLGSQAPVQLGSTHLEGKPPALAALWDRFNHPRHSLLAKAALLASFSRSRASPVASHAQTANTRLRRGKQAASHAMRVTTALRRACLRYPDPAQRASIPQVAQAPAQVAPRANTRRIQGSRAAIYVMRAVTILSSVPLCPQHACLALRVTSRPLTTRVACSARVDSTPTLCKISALIAFQARFHRNRKQTRAFRAFRATTAIGRPAIRASHLG